MITKIRQRNGIAIVEPNGKIMGPVASELWESILPQIEASDAPRILINFEHVSKIDSSGLGALMVARATIVQKKGRVGVINVGKQIKNLIVLSRLASLFEHFETEDAAISELAA